LHALIIEDEYFVADAIEQSLRDLGFTSFDDANCVAEAIAAARRRCPELIVADYRLVDGTGTEAVLAICAGRPIPVVFVTASAPEVRAALPSAIIVSKPFASLILRGAVKEARDRPFACPEA
jgi:CheY-like chemotaxis protein